MIEKETSSFRVVLRKHRPAFRDSCANSSRKQLVARLRMTEADNRRLQRRITNMRASYRVFANQVRKALAVRQFEQTQTGETHHV